MKAPRRNSLWLAMAAAFTLSAAAIAATPSDDEHDAHHPQVAQAEAASATPAETTPRPAMRMQAMRERMQAIREATDPQARLGMMDEQMADLEAMMKDIAACPMMSGTAPGRMGMGMMGGMGMGGMGMGGMGPGGTPMTQPEFEALRQQHVELMQKRIEMMEKRLDMMQMMMQMQMERQGRMPAAPATQ